MSIFFTATPRPAGESNQQHSNRTDCTEVLVIMVTISIGASLYNSALSHSGRKIVLQLVSHWFTDTRVSDEYQQRDYIILFGLLAAGAVLRFWGLGNVGLHGDEEKMAMPAMSILTTGEPTLPSGMHYARALLQIYLMSGSVWLFGESEWAFRLPSAVVGSVTGLAA